MAQGMPPHQEFSPPVGVQQGRQIPLRPRQSLFQRGGAKGVDVLLRIVQHRMKMGAQVHQRVIDPLNPAAEDAGELAPGAAGGGPGLRVDEVGHRLGLHQIQLAVEEGPPG